VEDLINQDQTCFWNAYEKLLNLQLMA